MSKVDLQTYKFSDGELHEWVTKQDCYCCFVHIAAHSPDKYDIGQIFITRLSMYPSFDTWRERLRAAWYAFRGNLYGDVLEFWSVERAKEFAGDLNEAIEVMEGKTKTEQNRKRY